MAFTIPVSRSVEITAAQTYVLTLAICNASSTASFGAYAAPLVSGGFRGKAFASPGATATTTLALTTGQPLRQITTTRDGYPVFDYAQSVPLTCIKDGTAVAVVFPMGTSYSRPSGGEGEFAAGASPSQYRYAVGTGSTDVATGVVRISIQNISPPAGIDFSICGVRVD
jgi:hypothetical protein